MTRLADYQNRFKFIRFRREDGILEMAIHRDGGTALWDFGETGIHKELGDAFYEVAHDRDNKVVIFTGTGDTFLDSLDYGDPTGSIALTPQFADRLYKEGKDLLHNLLDVEVPVIAAINGNAYIHSELPVMADIVIMADHARIADKVHFQGGAVPGDGVHVIWPMLLGPNRGRYFLITGQELDAQEALRLGVVGEVLPGDKLMKRAWDLARDIMQKPELVRRYTRVALTQHLKRRLLDDLGYGLMVESLAMMSAGKD
ncbi:MAG: enoyl-CoA hydratase/isomerase family protein [Rhodospirillaceae bacterium]|nr:MAG: enoyl-CoA hydratase/isomerase family protein [Rhodospirillaceae bacterium]